MSTVESILKLLEQRPIWKRMMDAPARVDELEKKVATLEDRLRRAPGEACPHCGALEYRVAESKPHEEFGHMGATARTMCCGECGFREDKLILPGRSR